MEYMRDGLIPQNYKAFQKILFTCVDLIDIKNPNVQGGLAQFMGFL
jgi:hypothetical protein